MISKKISRAKYWVGFWLSGVLGGVFGLVISGFAEPVFTAEAAIRIGTVGIPALLEQSDTDDDVIASYPVEELNDLIAVLRARYRIREAKVNQIPLPYLYSASTGESENILRLSTRGTSAQQAEVFLHDVVKWIIYRHSERIELARENSMEYLKQFVMLMSQATTLNDSTIGSDLANSTGSDVSIKNRSDAGALLLASGIHTPIRMVNSEIIFKPVANSEAEGPDDLVFVLAGIVTAMVGFMAYGLLFVSGVGPVSRKPA
ncbi:hypothetical protein OAI79_02405 [Gammaproteobacteria bacterium]|nr:hypothetical protein [Gammaproteobacteria bacterium]